MSKYRKEWEPWGSKEIMSGLTLLPRETKASGGRGEGGAGLKGVGFGQPSWEGLTGQAFQVFSL